MLGSHHLHTHCHPNLSMLEPAGPFTSSQSHPWREAQWVMLYFVISCYTSLQNIWAFPATPVLLKTTCWVLITCKHIATHTWVCLNQIVPLQAPSHTHEEKPSEACYTSLQNIWAFPATPILLKTICWILITCKHIATHTWVCFSSLLEMFYKLKNKSNTDLGWHLDSYDPDVSGNMMTRKNFQVLDVTHIFWLTLLYC